MHPGPSREYCEANAVLIPKLHLVDKGQDKSTGFYDPVIKKRCENTVPIESVEGREATRRATALQWEFKESFENERARQAKREDNEAALLANREKAYTICRTRFDRDLSAEGIILFRIHTNSMIILVQA